MRFLVLGPLEVRGDDDEVLSLPGAKERTVLGCLIAHAGVVVSIDTLIDELWGDDPPRTAEKTLGTHVSRIRRALDGESSPISITGIGEGYRLDADDGLIDAHEFERLAREGRVLLEDRKSSEAVDVLNRAIGLWRGMAYQDLRHTSVGNAEGERLEELHRSANEDLADARLDVGDSTTLIADLEGMVRAEPLREHRWAQLSLALYRAGRQAEALQAFNRAREHLVEELGIEPGAELRQLQASILAQEPLPARPWSATPAASSRTTEVCPYKGLARFETSDADFYFGREESVSRAIARLVGGRFLALVGASGSGKSSLLRAGVLHALEDGAVPGSDGWVCALIRPGEHPLRRWQEANGGAGRRAIAIDQFEEVFTTCQDETERAAFLEAIVDAVRPDGSVTVILAMRADYYGHCATYRPFAELLEAAQILVGPMDRKEIRRAIELPASRAHLEVEEKLTDALIEATAGQPGGLPLLETALLELWTRREDGTLTMDEYLRSGGVEGAVARLAEDAFGRLNAEEQPAARRILLRLAAAGDGTEAVSRQVPLGEFDLRHDPDAARALGILTEARLVTVSDSVAEVAHEALLREWPRLRDWLEDDAQGRRLHRQLSDAARTWQEGGRDVADLYRGARLTAALEWEHEHERDPNELERTFLAQSRTASEGEASRARRTNRRLRGLLSGVAVLLVLSLLVGNLALKQRDATQAAADVADSRQLAAASLTQRDGVVSLLLAREAVALDDSVQTRGALLAALQRQPAAIAEMHPESAAPGDLTNWLALSPDGHVIAAGGARPTVDFFDAVSHRSLGRVDVGAGTTGGDFSADGEILVVAAAGQRIAGIDVAARTIRTSVATDGRDVDAIAFTPDGALLTAESIGDEGFLIARDPVTLESRAPAVGSKIGPITAMAFSADGHRLVTTSLPLDYSNPGGHTVLLNARNLTQMSDVFPVGGNDVALSPDGRTAAIAASESSSRGSIDDLKGHLVMLNMRTGKQLTSLQGAPGTAGSAIGLTGVTFSGDGRRVASTDAESRVLIWEPESATIEEEFDDPTGLDVRAPTLSPDDGTLFTIDVDGNVVGWDLTGDRSIGQSFTAGSGTSLQRGGSWPFFAISPDGSTLAVIQASAFVGPGSVRLVDSHSLETTHVLPYDGAGFPQIIAFSPDSQTLAVTSFDGYVQLWDVQSGTPDGPPFQIPDSASPRIDFWVTAFSPDGRVLATGGAADYDNNSSPGVVYLWNVTTHQLLAELPELPRTVTAVDFSPDGKRLVTSTGINGAGYAVVWSLDEKRVELRIRADDSGIWDTDVSNDGSVLVTSGQEPAVRQFSLTTGRQIGPVFPQPVLPGPPKPSLNVDLSPDGSTLVAAVPGHVIMWDVATGSILGPAWFPDIGSDDTSTAAFTSDGRRLFIVSETGEAWVWDIDPVSWEQRACQIAGRSFTQSEWHLYLPDRPYQATCGS